MSIDLHWIIAILVAALFLLAWAGLVAGSRDDDHHGRD